MLLKFYEQYRALHTIVTKGNCLWNICRLLMFVTVCLVLLLGYPVALSLAGTALLFAGGGIAFGTFDSAFLNAFPSRLYGILNNQTLLAVPLFVFMGAMLERSKIAENLLNAMSIVFGRFYGGLGISVTIVGALLAASTGIVGANGGYHGVVIVAHYA